MPETPATETFEMTRVLEDANATLQHPDGNLVLDLTAVSRVTAQDLLGLERLATAAAEKGIAVALAHVSVEVYRVLKTAELAPHFTFVT